VGFHEVVKDCVRKYGHNCERLSWKYNDERFTTFATLADRRTELAKEYCRMNSTCGALQQNLCQRLTALRLTRRSFCCSFGLLRIRQSSPIDPTHRTPAPMIPFHQDEIVAQEATFRQHKELQTVSQKVMKTLTWNEFQNCFRSWISCWNRCINAKGDYFEEGGG